MATELKSILAEILAEARATPTPNHDVLSRGYWEAQIARVETIRQKIVSQSQPVVVGKSLPDDESLVIGKGRRLSMAVLFLDISSFSKRASSTQSEQEILLRIMNLFFTEMIRIAEDHGGTVEKNTGDGLMAYFEDASEHTEENGCKRALAAALTMFNINSNLLNPIISNSGLEPIQFRIGIDHGHVTIARVGLAKRFNSLVAIGATANIACKMLNRAGPGEIVIGDQVAKALPSDWHRFCECKMTDTGWVYTPSLEPYPFYKYTGRWTGPQ